MSALDNVCHMAGSWRTRAALTVVLLAFGATGCAGDTDPVDPPISEHDPTLSIPEEQPTGSPGADESDKPANTHGTDRAARLSPKERKAADAAVAAFTKYLRVSDAVMQDGGRHPERLKTVATGIMLAADKNDAASFLASKQHVVGRSVFDHLSIKNVSLSGVGSSNNPTVKISACVDVHRTQVQRADGSVVKQGDRKLRWPSTYIVANIDQQWLIQNLVQGRGKC